MAWTIQGRTLYIARFKRDGERKVHLWQQWHKDVTTARVAFRRTLNAEFRESWVMLSVKQATAAEEKRIRGGHPLKNPVDWKVEEYSMKAGSGSGRHVRKATRVISPDGRKVEFIEKMSRRAAIKQAKDYLKRNPELLSAILAGAAAGTAVAVTGHHLKKRLRAHDQSNAPGGFSIAMVPRKGARLVLPRVYASKAEAQRRASKIRRPFGTRTAVVPVARNPYDAAAAASEGFHGRAVQETIEFVTEKHSHEYLAALGELIKLEVLAPDSDSEIIPLKGFEGAWLAENEEKNQLFLLGGDQSLSDDELLKFGIDVATLHETEVLGPLAAVTYHTVKYHLGEHGGDANFRHVFGEEGGRLPVLVYRVRDGLVEIAGGSYTIPDEGITN